MKHIELPFAVLVSVAFVGCMPGCPKGGDGGGTTTTDTGSAAAPAAPAVDPAKAATITGKVKFEGAPPAMEPIDMAGNPKCHSQHPGGAMPEAYVVENGMLKNVIVYVKEGLSGSYAAPADAVMIDQKGCMYIPHVISVQTNQPIKIKNSDPETHNVHALPKKQPEFNFGQPEGSADQTKKFKTAEMVKVRCDVHGWMGAYIGVFDHPFHAVTNEAGEFTIKGLPPGEYTLEAWHEKLPAQTMKVKVGEKESKAVDFSFKM
jgi:hypothetical protein